MLARIPSACSASTVSFPRRQLFLPTGVLPTGVLIVSYQLYGLFSSQTYTVASSGREVYSGWALNEVSVEKANRQRMIELIAEVDGRPLSRWGCDGLVLATPTGSTAYAFSAGGPIVAPEVEALLLVPISAHAVFSRPLVVGPASVIAVEVLPGAGEAVLFCDGRRTFTMPASARVEVRKGHQPVLLARVHPVPFSERLVAKFALPVDGWRGRSV